MDYLVVDKEYSTGQVLFQWGGTISALFLLILNCTGRRSYTVTTLLVFYLLTSFPSALFNILRGQFGQWIAFLAVAANLLFPHLFPASRFILFVITPEWLVDALRYSIFGGCICLIVGVLLAVIEFRAILHYGACSCTLSCFCYFIGIVLILFFSAYLFAGYL